jgi:hypothetical protein
MLTLSYCVPVMNRLGDLQATLAHNLNVLADFKGDAELVVNCFDSHPACAEWVHANFGGALDDGRLRFFSLPALPYWHFSRAKNSFAGRIAGRYYSSLDGDNFLSGADVGLSLDIIGEDPSREYLIHHFSGNWGDGSSGRVTVPAELYARSPYIEEIYPRQFDEVGLILRILKEYPWVTFVSRPVAHLFEKSQFARDFIERNRLYFRHVTMDLGSGDAPVNPRGEGYVEKDEALFHFQKVNAAYSMYTLSDDPEARDTYAGSLADAQNGLINSGACSQVVQYAFAGTDRDRLEPSGQTTLYAVIRNDRHLLGPWLAHYRAIGIERFVIVDDHSDPPLAGTVSGDDVFLVTPVVGSFRTSKAAWISMLLKCFQHSGSWVMTADSDEFVDVIPPPDAHLDGRDRWGDASRQPPSREPTPLEWLIRHLETAGAGYVPGLLYDLMPPAGIRVTTSDFLDTMIEHLSRPGNDAYGYQDLKPIRWAFGPWWRYSFAIDLRYRLFGTIDCLRKIPLFCYRHDLELNQGFHTLHQAGRGLSAGDVWKAPALVLPVRHYKMLNALSDETRLHDRRVRLGGYFGRTQSNLARIYRADRDRILEAWNLSPFRRPYDPGARIRALGGTLVADLAADLAMDPRGLRFERSSL